MFEPLFTWLSDRYHLIAPDYSGLGHSNWPDPKRFAYTFDHIAEIMNPFTEALGLSRYTLYMAGLRRPRGFSHGPGASGPDRGPDRGAAASCAQRRLGGELECGFVILSP
jgi:hypothetical protein